MWTSEIVWAIRAITAPSRPLDTYQFMLVVMIYVNSLTLLLVT